MRKFKDFPTNKILREINFDEFRLQESTILAILEARHINFGEIIAIFASSNFQKSEFRTFEIVKMVVLKLLNF